MSVSESAPAPSEIQQISIPSEIMDVDTTATASEPLTQFQQPPPSNKRKTEDDEPKEPLSEVILRRLTRIKEGDTVMLKLPSDAIKVITVEKNGLIQLGKYGAFPSSQLLGMHYDITYEIIGGPSASGSGSSTPLPFMSEENGQNTKNKKKGKSKENDNSRTNPGWKNVLRPLKRQNVVDAVVDDITETNEHIHDLPELEKQTLSHDEINELRSQGLSVEEIIKKQEEAHEMFKLKTEFSKEKWRRRKEKKFSTTVHPLSPSIPNILHHYSERSPASVLHLRVDTLSQLLNMANIRPGGRYLVVDDTSGLVTAAILERMGSEGKILLFNNSDSPPAWSILQSMNISERELKGVKCLNWMEAQEDYERPPPPPEDDNAKPAKVAQRLRKHNAQVAELNATRDELHMGGWDGLILATTLSPISVLSFLTQYLIGSAPIVVYSPHMQVLAELLAWSKKDPHYLHDTLSESWERTYQVLPGRTHPMMNTSTSGGWLWSAIRVHPSQFQPESHSRFKRRKTGKQSGKETPSGEGGNASAEEKKQDESGAGPGVEVEAEMQSKADTSISEQAVSEILGA
ncbi:tRNA (adenine-N(1)-)-methyltransferase non-catalytic subunit TRM6 [Kwoniella mangroviensis CBS 8886]|nr:tRNA (adenine-N(1)-)-methyltransferase non-catalytic subunit TRM6 [Kwoniella mangroviensis CBS 8886]